MEVGSSVGGAVGFGVGRFDGSCSGDRVGDGFGDRNESVSGSTITVKTLLTMILSASIHSVACFETTCY